jgi:hypothetical protein
MLMFLLLVTFSYTKPIIARRYDDIRIYVFDEIDEHKKFQITAFSSKSHFGRLEGYLAISDPIYACSAVRHPPHISRVNRWILLIEDNSYVEKCSIDEKVLNAQIAGYEAVIIYNPNLKKAELVLKYSQDENKAIIPALFIDYSNATALKSFHLKNPSYVIIYGRQ